MTLSSRLAKLETHASTGKQIPVWCDDVADMAATIDAMIADGEIRDADRARCVHWPDASGPGRHEAALAVLQ